MNILAWEDDYNDNGDDFDGVDTVVVFVDVDAYVSYRVEVEVKTFRGIPATTEAISAERIEYNNDRRIIDEQPVQNLIYIENIVKTAEQEALYMMGG
jgi:hypothetical protein